MNWNGVYASHDSADVDDVGKYMLMLGCCAMFRFVSSLDSQTIMIMGMFRGVETMGEACLSLTCINLHVPSSLCMGIAERC